MEDGVKLKVLIADDEPEVLAIVSRRVAAAGFDVVTAPDGREAWDKIRELSPDIIVLDISMPYKDGLSILKDLRADPPPGKWQPVIIVSARNELDDLRRGRDLDADHYLTKPCTAEEIVGAVRLMASLIPLRNV